MKKLVFILLVCIMMVLATGCFEFPDFSATAPTPRPVYDMEETEEGGMTINIAGVIYKELPKTKWEMHPEGYVDIGYGGSKDVSITAVQGDVVRNFIYVFTNRYDGGIYLYRTDIEVPVPSGDSVDEIYFRERDFSIKEGDQTINSMSIYDKSIIKEFFDELFENSDNVFSPEEVKSFGDIYFEITCSSQKVPGTYYDLHLEYLNGSFVCGNNIEGYVAVSLEVIEKLAGQEIDLDALISGR